MWGQGKVYERAKKYYVAAEARKEQVNSGEGVKKVYSDVSTVNTSTTSKESKQSFKKSEEQKKRFGKSRNSKKDHTKAEEALTMINDTIRSQEDRENELQNSYNDAINEAKVRMTDGNKRAAIRYMRKAKLYKLEQDKIGGAIETMEAQVLQIESALNNIQVIEAMRAGSHTMQSLQSADGNKLESVDQILDEIRDTSDYAQEIQYILSQPVHVVADDDELLNELEQLTAGDHSDGINLPSAPTSKIVQQEEEKKANSGKWSLLN